MNTPWVSRLAYDAVCSERDSLRAQVTSLTDALTRIQRVEHGLPEVPRTPREPLEPMPKSLREYIEAFSTPSIKKAMRDNAYRKRLQGVPWQEIEEDAKAVQEDPVYSTPENTGQTVST